MSQRSIKQFYYETNNRKRNFPLLRKIQKNNNNHNAGVLKDSNSLKTVGISSTHCGCNPSINSNGVVETCKHQSETIGLSRNMDTEKQSVPSLYSLTMNYVTDNIDIVDSFEGFPEIIGEEIFQSCCNRGVFGPPLHQPRATQALQLFCNAYRTPWMRHFSFTSKCESTARATTQSPTNNRRFIAKYGDMLSPILQYVSELDISIDNLLADDFLRCLCDFKHLTKLKMANANLNSEGLRLLLSKHRVHKVGFEQLQVFDLEGTHLVANNLNTVLNFPKLKYLAFSVRKDNDKQAQNLHYKSKMSFNFTTKKNATETLVEETNKKIMRFGFQLTKSISNYFDYQDEKSEINKLLNSWIADENFSTSNSKSISSVSSTNNNPTSSWHHVHAQKLPRTASKKVPDESTEEENEGKYPSKKKRKIDFSTGDELDEIKWHKYCVLMLK